MLDKNLNFAFFGTSEFAVNILEKLIENDYIPSLVITTPDKPKGRNMIVTPPPVKVSTLKHNLKTIQPEKLNAICHKLSAIRPAFFIVASYGKIIPKSVLEIPKFGALNVHPSLLPKFRGPSPIQSFILSGEGKTGVTIMLMDEEVDHGPILAQRELEIQNKSEILNSKQLEEKLAELGGQMLINVIPKWVNDEIKPQEQGHNQSTFTKKIEKENGLINLEKDNPEIIYRKFLAFQPWPGVYFFTKKKGKEIRVIITDMELLDGPPSSKTSASQSKLKINKVKPEGKNEMTFVDFLN